MAFSIKQTKAILQEYGIPAENLDAAAERLCAAHKTDLDAIKEERDTYKRDAEALATVQKELDDLKARQDDGFKEKYEQEKAAYKEFRKETAKKETLAAKTKAFREILKDANITSEQAVAKVLKYTNLDSDDYALDENGKFKDAKKILKSVQEEWPEQITHETVRGAETPAPPANNGGRTVTKEQIMGIKDAGERQRAIAANLDLFGAK